LDWVPSGADAPATRSIATVDSCNECHGELAIHGGGRRQVEYCVTCHNPGSTDANSGETVDFSVLAHSLHRGIDLPVGPYVIWGYRDSEHDYSHVGYPQEIQNCVKCHDSTDEATPDGDNWFERPSAVACEGCHNDLDVRESTTEHLAGMQVDDSNCSTCHTSETIQASHLTENATPNNPGLADGLWDITYALQSATMSGNTLTVELVIEADGTALDLTSLPDDLSDPGRYPNLMLAWAEAQDGMAAPSDWNNLGNDSGQPTRMSLGNLVSDGAVSHSAGVNTLVVEEAFPTGASLRAVAIEGYFRQDVDGDEVARHAVSVILSVDGDEERRTVVDGAKCGSCHEWFEAHGGNRVYEPQVCAMCHNPNLSSSGTELDPDNPEASNALRDMVHGIHAPSVREQPLDFVRNRNGGSQYTFIAHDQLEDYPDGHVVAYPNDIGDCTVCHDGDTYLPESVPVDGLASTHVTWDGTSDIDGARATVPNDDDEVTSPTAAGCGSCHDSHIATAHMEQNGGAVLWPRYEWVDEGPYETCALCHGEGRSADVTTLHPVD
jgi:OmcA/MtrC family decaheme c-type cytochrome